MTLIEDLKSKTKTEIKALSKTWSAFKDTKPVAGAIAMVDGKGQCLYGEVTMSGGGEIKFDDGDSVALSKLTSGKFTQEQAGGSGDLFDPEVVKALYVEKRGKKASDRTHTMYRFRAKGYDSVKGTWDRKYVDAQFGGGKNPGLYAKAVELMDAADAGAKSAKGKKQDGGAAGKKDSEEAEEKKPEGEEPEGEEPEEADEEEADKGELPEEKDESDEKKPKETKSEKPKKKEKSEDPKKEDPDEEEEPSADQENLKKMTNAQLRDILEKEGNRQTEIRAD